MVLVISLTLMEEQKSIFLPHVKSETMEILLDGFNQFTYVRIEKWFSLTLVLMGCFYLKVLTGVGVNLSPNFYYYLFLSGSFEDMGIFTCLSIYLLWIDITRPPATRKLS